MLKLHFFPSHAFHFSIYEDPSHSTKTPNIVENSLEIALRGFTPTMRNNEDSKRPTMKPGLSVKSACYSGGLPA